MFFGKYQQISCQYKNSFITVWYWSTLSHILHDNILREINNDKRFFIQYFIIRSSNIFIKNFMIDRRSKNIKRYEYLIFTITIYCHSENPNNIFDTNGILLFDDCISLLFYFQICIFYASNFLSYQKMFYLKR